MTVSAPLKRRFLLVGSVALLVLLFLFVLLRTGPLAPVQVTVAEVRSGRFTPELFGIGTLEARRHWILGPTTPGRVLTVKVDVGDQVRAGQLLAEMDPVDLDQRLQALDASIARASSTQAAAAAQQSDAQARRELAAANLRRNHELAQQNFISAGALEARSQELASAEAALESARATAQAAAQDALRAKAERAALQQQRANAKLFAPADAVVSAREAEPGSTVVAGQAVLRLTLPLENESLAEWLNASKERGNEEDGEVALHAGVQAGGGKAGGIWAEYRGGGAQPGFGGADVVQLGEGAA